MAMTTHHLDAFRIATAVLLITTDRLTGADRRPVLRPAGAPVLGLSASPHVGLPLWDTTLTARDHARRLLAWWHIALPAGAYAPDHVVPAAAYADFMNTHGGAALDADMLTVPVRPLRRGAGYGAAGMSRASHRLVLRMPEGHAVDGTGPAPTLLQCLQQSDPEVLQALLDPSATAVRALLGQPLDMLTMPTQSVAYFRAGVGLPAAEDNINPATLFTIPSTPTFANASGSHQNGPGSTIGPQVVLPHMPAPPASLSAFAGLAPDAWRRAVRDAGLTPEQRAQMAAALLLTVATDLRRSGDEAGARRAARCAERCAGVLEPGTWPRHGGGGASAG